MSNVHWSQGGCTESGWEKAATGVRASARAFCTSDAERASSNITAEQLSAAQSAVQRATRGLTGPEAARVLDADGAGLSCCC